MSTRDTLRKAKPKVVEVPTDDGGKVYVRAMSGAKRAEYLDLVREAGSGGPPMANTAALGLCESDGEFSYDASSGDDIAELAAIDGALLERICLALFEASGLTKNAAEDAEKKSEASPS